MKVILHFRKKSYMRGKFDQKFFLKMEVLKKHLETYVKKFWRLRETEIRSKPLYQKGGSTPKTVIWNISICLFRTLPEHLPHEHCSRMCLEDSKKKLRIIL